MQEAAPGLNGELHVNSVLEHASAAESRIASSAAASTSAHSPEKAKRPQSARKASLEVARNAAAAERTSPEAHTPLMQAEEAAYSVMHQNGLLVGSPEGVSEIDPALQGLVDEIMARRCPNLNRFQNGSAYDVKVNDQSLIPFTKLPTICFCQGVRPCSVL